MDFSGLIKCGLLTSTVLSRFWRRGVRSFGSHDEKGSWSGTVVHSKGLSHSFLLLHLLARSRC